MRRATLLLLVYLIASPILAADNTVRMPAVAGTFYPQDKKELSKMVDRFLSNAATEKVPGEIVALISPHAGFIYSGQVAAYGYSLVKDQHFDSVILMGPSHHASFQGASIWQEGSWKTPLGEVPIDTELATAIAKDSLLFQNPSDPHIPEHSLETQIPFLQKTVKNLRIVPILLGAPSLNHNRLLADAIVRKISGKKVLIIASTDMSHYYPSDVAYTMDRLALQYIEEEDPKGLHGQLWRGKSELCGAGAVLTLLEIGKLLGRVETKVLKYATSGDVTGDNSQVVGYSSSILYKGQVQKNAPVPSETSPTPSSESETGALNLAQQSELLAIARQTLETRLEKGEIPLFQPKDPALLEKRGVFVTLKKNGQLRGCIGQLLPLAPLHEAVRDISAASALTDTRFQPVKGEELQELEIEISVLTLPRKVANADEIELGKHGVILKHGENSGVFLPQVAKETGWTKEEFLNELASQKAGLAPDAWKDPQVELYVFEAQVFSEKG